MVASGHEHSYRAAPSLPSTTPGPQTPAAVKTPLGEGRRVALTRRGLRLGQGNKKSEGTGCPVLPREAPLGSCPVVPAPSPRHEGARPWRSKAAGTASLTSAPARSRPAASLGFHRRLGLGQGRSSSGFPPPAGTSPPRPVSHLLLGVRLQGARRSPGAPFRGMRGDLGGHRGQSLAAAVCLACWLMRNSTQEPRCEIGERPEQGTGRPLPPAGATPTTKRLTLGLRGSASTFSCARFLRGVCPAREDVPGLGEARRRRGRVPAPWGTGCGTVTFTRLPPLPKHHLDQVESTLSGSQPGRRGRGHRCWPGKAPCGHKGCAQAGGCAGREPWGQWAPSPSATSHHRPVSAPGRGALLPPSPVQGWPGSSPPRARAGPAGRRADTYLWEPWGQDLPARKATEH